ncbi:maternal pumilio protein [Vairimorpha apis BRL 01]|uniref:Maternal pumilio protein n=1 Tax=Vairimorpha apis BRL 01 TaxID=1037528 RepID=T0L020_9MICR|nr:maternal pumilio protein [Vairimorpha apis BRL 01]
MKKMFKKFLRILIKNLNNLVNDQYGNYVIQHMLTMIVTTLVNINLVVMLSNSVLLFPQNQKEKFLNNFLETLNGKPKIYYMCADMYGNYVVQKFYESVDENMKDKIKKY